MGEQKTPDESSVADSDRPTRPRRIRRLAWWFGSRVAVVYLGLMVVAMFFEERLIFFPSRYPEGDWNPRGLTVEDAEFTADDGVRLHGWFCPVENPRAVVLVSHGNAGNITHRDEEIKLWQRHLGVSIFIYDYRGFGRSEGSPNEAGVYADVRAAYRWLTEQKQIAAEEIVLRGESIGSAVSLQLALEVPHRALIMESPFTSAVAMGQRSFPFLPVRWVMRNRFDSDRKISQYRGPLLITHGTRDSIVPFEMGEALFGLANDPKKFYPVRGADHNDVPFTGGAAYFRAIDEFLENF
jgi:fermentation-respiration switch protein FrsA (DUF1100 family)